MGKEATVTVVFADGADEGRLQYEPPKLVFKGKARRVFDAEALKGVTANGADLVLADGSRFTLGEKQAAAWLDAQMPNPDIMPPTPRQRPGCAGSRRTPDGRGGSGRRCGSPSAPRC